MEIELSILNDESDHVHKILDRAVVDDLTVKAQAEIEQEEMDMS